MQNKSKLWSGVAGIAVLVACGAPASASDWGEYTGPNIEVPVTDVGIVSAQGEALPAYTAESIGIYAGPITMKINGVSTMVWCDDLANTVVIGGYNPPLNYYETDANVYLAGISANPADENTIIKQIAGLAYYGTYLGGTTNTEGVAGATDNDAGAAIQLAIWELIDGGSDSDSGGNVQTLANSDISAASGYYADMWEAGYSYAELESPGCGQDAGSIAYTNGCQIQGQIVTVPNGGPGNNGLYGVPEPGSLGILGAGLLGLAGFSAFLRRPSPVA